MAFKDIALDLDTGDIRWEGGDLVLIEGEDLSNQEVFLALNTHQGEWFMDTEDGVPYRQILTKGMTYAQMVAFFRAYIPKADGVRWVQTVAIEVDAQDRLGTVDLVYVFDSGRTGQVTT